MHQSPAFLRYCINFVKRSLLSTKAIHVAVLPVPRSRVPVRAVGLLHIFLRKT